MFNVVFASSNEYSSFLVISLTSLLENNKDFDCINVFILDNGINENNKNKIVALTEKYSCKITFIENIFESINVKLPPIELKSIASIYAYSRLYISNIIPEDIDKILYLDSDSLVLGSFKELWNMDLEDCYCAGVLDPLNGFPLKKDYWYLNVDSYINSGFMLINLKKWRDNNIEEKFNEFISENYEKFFWADQGVINIVLQENIKIVEPKYNLLFYFQYMDYELAKRFCGIKTDYYSKEIVDESKKNPIFVHFAADGYRLPWINKDHKYSSLYRKYAKMANCEDVIKYEKAPTFIAKLMSRNNRLLSFILKLIPANIIINYKNNETVEHLRERENNEN